MINHPNRNSEAARTWAADRRLDYIDWRLAGRGEVQRADLVRTFSVSMQQASHDLGEFQRLYPDATTYDKSARRYVPAGRTYRARRKMDNPNIRRALSLLAAENHPLGWAD